MPCTVPPRDGSVSRRHREEDAHLIWLVAIVSDKSKGDYLAVCMPPPACHSCISPTIRTMEKNSKEENIQNCWPVSPLELRIGNESTSNFRMLKASKQHRTLITPKWSLWKYKGQNGSSHIYFKLQKVAMAENSPGSKSCPSSLLLQPPPTATKCPGGLGDPWEQEGLWYRGQRLHHSPPPCKWKSLSLTLEVLHVALRLGYFRNRYKKTAPFPNSTSLQMAN